ncbi:MAG: cytochrome c-type biogenesis protein CcmH [Acidobacteriota bacterium]|nr:MAG: cytochrome c-type biogenesis protein CcmH [Acidobacteriota bacterium]
MNHWSILRVRNLFFPLLIVVAILGCFSLSVSADEVGDPKVETEAKAIEGLLISPCCWRQPVSVHFSPASDEVRAEVRQMLASGMTRAEILDKFVAEYGERILAKPPAEGFGAFAYVLPVIFLVLGAAVALLVIQKLRPRAAVAADPGKARTVDSKYAKQLEEEMWG